MAYFSNGTEGQLYEEKWCSRCVHRNGLDGRTGCPVMLAHILYAYEECNSKSNAKSMLDFLIPMEEVKTEYGMCHFPAQCSMFKEGEAVPDPAEIIGELQTHNHASHAAMGERTRIAGLNLFP